MDKAKPKFVSNYKIDGVPILPPLMTDQRRLEMRKYREMAIAKEQQKLSMKSKNISLPVPKNVKNVEKVPPQSSIIVDEGAISPSIDQDLSNYLNISDLHLTFGLKEPEVTDEVNSRYMQISSMLSHTHEYANESDVHEKEISFFQLDSQATSANNTSANNTSAEAEDIQDSDSVLAKPVSRLSDCESSMFDDNSTTVTELIEINTTSTELDDHTVDEIRPTSPVTQPRLIRSNSYTLEGPSPLFLMHHANKVASESDPMTKSETTPSTVPVTKNEKTKNITKVSLTKKAASGIKPSKSSSKLGCDVKLPVRAASVGNRRTTTTNSITESNPKGQSVSSKCKDAKSKMQHNRVRSIYDPKPKTVTAPVPATPVQPPQRPMPVSSPRISRPQEERLIEFITQMEHNRKQQMDLLIERQEIEQRKMQETFKREQELLIKQITDNCSNMLNSYQIGAATIAKDMISASNIDNEKMHYPATVNNFVNVTSNQFLTVSAGIIEENNNDTVLTKDECNTSSSKSSAHRKLFNETEESVIRIGKNSNDNDASILREKAATIINAGVRGYLTRRLFKTEDVQTVVKIIQDTLLFIIDMHHENRPMSNEADMNLKRSLINQLNSSCYLMHDIFFGKTIAEQMEIISTDRKMLKKKLNRSRKNSLQPVTSQNSLNKLAKVVLFSIDIPSDRIQKFTQSQTILRNLNSIALPTRPHSK